MAAWVTEVEEGRAAAEMATVEAEVATVEVAVAVAPAAAAVGTVVESDGPAGTAVALVAKICACPSGRCSHNHARTHWRETARFLHRSRCGSSSILQVMNLRCSCRTSWNMQACTQLVQQVATTAVMPEETAALMVLATAVRRAGGSLEEVVMALAVEATAMAAAAAAGTVALKVEGGVAAVVAVAMVAMVAGAKE